MMPMEMLIKREMTSTPRDVKNRRSSSPLVGKRDGEAEKTDEDETGAYLMEDIADRKFSSEHLRYADRGDTFYRIRIHIYETRDDR